MDAISMSTVMYAAGLVSAVGGAIVTIQRINKNFKREKDLEAARIIHTAKEEDSLLRAKMEQKIDALKWDLKNLEASVNKDLEHIKESHSNEIKALGEKIDNLRDDLRGQHGNLLTLITKLVANTKT